LLIGTYDTVQDSNWSEINYILFDAYVTKYRPYITDRKYFVWCKCYPIDLQIMFN